MYIRYQKSLGMYRLSLWFRDYNALGDYLLTYSVFLLKLKNFIRFCISGIVWLSISMLLVSIERLFCAYLVVYN